MRIDKNEWNELLIKEFSKDYYVKLNEFIENEYKNYNIFPEKDMIFDSLKYTDYKDVKVLILGQDPYHGKGQAHGMAFSVNTGVKIPPSLLNIYKELRSDLNCYIPNNGYLMPWAKQGVLLLNTSLTVREGEANSHSKKGWEVFTDKIIKILNDRKDPVIFVLWGLNARKKKSLINEEKHYVLEAPHPSPLSANRGFFCCKHFSKINNILLDIKKTPIDWQILDI